MLSLKKFLSKYSSIRETLLRQTSFLDYSHQESLKQESIVAQNMETLKQLEQKCIALTQGNQENFYETIEQNLQLLDQQLKLINAIIKKQNNRNKIKYNSIRLNILEKAAQHFNQIWKLDNENIDHLIKYLDIVKCYKGNFSDQYLQGLCELSLSIKNYQELEDIYQQLNKNYQSETQKYCAMTLFILTKNEFYYEHFLLNDSEIQDKSFEIKFHLFASQYFEEQNCHHTTHFHKQQCQFMSSEYQRAVAQGKMELQLSFMKTNHQL